MIAFCLIFIFKNTLYRLIKIKNTNVLSIFLEFISFLKKFMNNIPPLFVFYYANLLKYNSSIGTPKFNRQFGRQLNIDHTTVDYHLKKAGVK